LANRLCDVVAIVGWVERSETHQVLAAWLVRFSFGWTDPTHSSTFRTRKPLSSRNEKSAIGVVLSSGDDRAGPVRCDRQAKRRQALMDFPDPIRTTGSGVRGIIRSTEEAIRFIDRELPAELKKLPRWTFARELLLVAERSEKKRDLKHAYRQLRQGLSNDRLLDLSKADDKVPERDAV
jgi:hypothetical protein